MDKNNLVVVFLLVIGWGISKFLDLFNNYIDYCNDGEIR